MYKYKYLKYKIKYLKLIGGNENVSSYFKNIYIPQEHNDLLIRYGKSLNKDNLTTAERKYIKKMTLENIPVEVDNLTIGVQLSNLYFYVNFIVPLYNNNFDKFMIFVNKYISENSDLKNISCLFKQMFFYNFVSHDKIQYRNFMLFIKPDEVNVEYQKIRTNTILQQPHITVVQRCRTDINIQYPVEKIFMDTVYLLFYWSILLDKYHMSCEQYYNNTRIGDYFERNLTFNTESKSRIVMDDLNQMITDINEFVKRENLPFCEPHYDTAHIKDKITKNNVTYSMVTYFYVFHDNNIIRYVDYEFRLSSIRFLKHVKNYEYDISINDLLLRIFFNSEFLFVFDNAKLSSIDTNIYNELLFIDESYIKNQKNIISDMINYVSMKNIYNFACIFKNLYRYIFKTGQISYKHFVSEFYNMVNINLSNSKINNINNNDANNVFFIIIQIMIYFTFLLNKTGYECDDLLKNGFNNIDYNVSDDLVSFINTLAI